MHAIDRRPGGVSATNHPRLPTIFTIERSGEAGAVGRLFFFDEPAETLRRGAGGDLLQLGQGNEAWVVAALTNRNAWLRAIFMTGANVQTRAATQRAPSLLVCADAASPRELELRFTNEREFEVWSSERMLPNLGVVGESFEEGDVRMVVQADGSMAGHRYYLNVSPVSDTEMAIETNSQVLAQPFDETGRLGIELRLPLFESEQAARLLREVVGSCLGLEAEQAPTILNLPARSRKSSGTPVYQVRAAPARSWTRLLWTLVLVIVSIGAAAAFEALRYSRAAPASPPVPPAAADHTEEALPARDPADPAR